MEKTIGKKLSELRRQKGLTQEAVAKYLGVSPQAVSKWENDFSCPDIMMLPKIARLYGITVDELFNEDSFDTASEIFSSDFTAEAKKNESYVNTEDLQLNIYVDDAYGNNVWVHLPFVLVKEIINTGKNLSLVLGNVDLSGLDLESIFRIIESGVVGEIVKVSEKNGNTVRVVVE